MTTITKNESGQKSTITYKDVADYFLALANEAGEPITNLKLQKLLYYAQAWYLANKNKPLFDAKFEAWVHGPVIPELYDEFKKFGSSPINKSVTLDQIKIKISPEVLDFLEEVAKVYMSRGAYELELMTHQEQPWLSARHGLEPSKHSNAEITSESMRIYYGQQIQNQAQ